MNRRILAVLRDGERRGFQRLLSEVGFSHNTLRQHLDKLVEQGLVERLKTPRNGSGRPTFTYWMSRGARRASFALVDPYSDLVVLLFERL